ncbi:hypothetical protein [Paenibacillus donghaensis]|uniref:Glycosyl-4,4'-diaponeurosporenoate acyltransferase n=1 Tax=Paenibacillus donghaensis TaxID=414771 RepID=A0A2Z2KMB1_9BACL|nr:hypothetical protein [Paenibacillus donghaensis]ASA21201.1 hypothetical protein B9T62_10635 [Paenibacillus donghaensis]
MEQFYLVLEFAGLNLVFWTVINGGFGLVMRLLPRSLFDYRRRLYKEHPFEKSLYKKIKVAGWKDRMPEWGHRIGFSKQTLASTSDIHYINRFIYETCIAELGHLIMGVLGYTYLLLAYLLPAPLLPVYMYVLISTLHLVFQMMLVIIQRYNRPRLLKLRNRVLAVAPGLRYQALPDDP